MNTSTTLRFAAILTLALAATVRAQAVPAPAPGGPDELGDAPAEAAAPAGRTGWSDADVDGLIFRCQTGVDGRGWFEDYLRLTVEAMGRVCKPTEAQGARLLLAARGDQKRLLDIVERKESEFRRIADKSARDTATSVGIWPLQQLVQVGAFGRNSLLDKVARSTLSATQLALYDEGRHRRRAYLQRAKIELVVALIDQTLGLTDEQRGRLVEAIDAGAKLPDRTVNGGQPELVLYLASRLPEAKLRPIFDDAQWGILAGMLVEARGRRESLKLRGLLLDESLDLRSAVEADKSYEDIIQ